MPVTTPPDTPCREYQGHLNHDGYGRFGDNARKGWMVHRWVVAQIDGEAAIKGKVVMHRCDNRACFRYDHLVIGTQQDNIKDMNEKGRYVKGLIRRGEVHACAKLTEAQVVEIAATYAEGGISMKKLGARYGVSAQTVHNIVHGARWSHVPTRPPALR